MLPLKTAALCALLLLALNGCVNPSSSSPTGAGSGGKSAVLFKVSGRDISAEEFLSSPPIRQAVYQFLLFDAMKAECSKKNIKVDEGEVEKRVEQQKQSALMQGKSWDDFLKDNNLTEAEYREMIKTPMLAEQLINSEVVVSDDELKQDWDKEKDMIIGAYIQENHLPDSERPKVTFEQTKEFNRKRMQSAKGQQYQQKVLQDLINGLVFDVSPTIKDPKKAKVLEDLIINNRKKPEEQAADKGPGVQLGTPQGQSGSAGAGAPPAPQQGGGAAAPPSGGAAPPAGGAAPPAGGAAPPAGNGKTGDGKQGGGGSTGGGTAPGGK